MSFDKPMFLKKHQEENIHERKKMQNPRKL